MEIEPPDLSKRDQDIANQYGGADTFNYQAPTESPSYDKPDHAERSAYWQPSHKDNAYKHAVPPEQRKP